METGKFPSLESFRKIDCSWVTPFLTSIIYHRFYQVKSPVVAGPVFSKVHPAIGSGNP